jgi:hypothetical protein
MWVVLLVSQRLAPKHQNTSIEPLFETLLGLVLMRHVIYFFPFTFDFYF